METIHDDKKLEQFIKDNVTPTHYVQGTNRMGPDSSSGVADAVGQVYAVKDLIVADDSIAPNGVGVKLHFIVRWLGHTYLLGFSKKGGVAYGYE